MGVFWAAVKGGRVAEVRCLLADGADIGPRVAPAQKGCSPLHAAAADGHPEIVCLLLQYGAELAATDNNGTTAIHYASAHKHTEVVRVLLHHGAEVDAKDAGGRTPLHYAALAGDPAPLQLLLDTGADVLAKDNAGWTPLHSSMSGSNVNMEVVALLLQSGASTEEGVELTSVIAAGEYVVIAAPLHLAILWDSAALVLLLLQNGAAPSGKDNIDMTPLHYTAMRGNEESLAATGVLLQYNADVSARNIAGWTPLHLAASRGHVAVILLLIDKGADVSAKDTVGDTPLHHAAVRGHFDAVRLLLDKGADLAAENIETAEEMATENGYPQIAAMLKAEAAGLHFEVAAIIEAGSP